MTNKPMLSVERELLERLAVPMLRTPEYLFDHRDALDELRALLDKPVPFPGNPPVPDDRKLPAAQHQGEPVAQSEFEPDAICLESDGCPTEGAVLKRFWRENQPDPVLCEFYEAEDFPSLVRELVGHVAQLQEAAKRNVKPWEDTFPPTLLPAYIARINAEQPAPVIRCSFCDVTDNAGNPWSGHHESVDGKLIYRVMGCKDHKHLVEALDGSKSTPVEDHTQCEECKGWGYHENHHEGGGTECGECGGSGNATVAVAVVMPDFESACGHLVETAKDSNGEYINSYAVLGAQIWEAARINGAKP